MTQILNTLRNTFYLWPIGFRRDKQNFPLNYLRVVDKALDKRYSLGNDLNAIGGRYTNTAAPRKFYVGVKFNPVFEKNPQTP